jgi:hypothetical protein
MTKSRIVPRVMVGSKINACLRPSLPEPILGSVMVESTGKNERATVFVRRLLHHPQSAGLGFSVILHRSKGRVDHVEVGRDLA